MAAGTKAYLKRTATLKEEMLSPADLARLNEFETRQDYDSAEYNALMMEKLYPQMLCRIKPWLNAVDRAFQHMNEEIDTHMQGKSEFVVTGHLRNWERWDRLHEIRVRTLTMGARYDGMDPEDMKQMAAMVRRGSYAYCARGSHFSFWDDQESYFSQLLGFLRTV